MKVRIGRDELLTGLQRVQGVVEKRNTMPILSNILLEAKQDGVEIVATDLEIGMRGLYKGTVLSTGGVTISARKLFEIVKELPPGEIELTATRQQLDDHPGREEPIQGRRPPQQRLSRATDDRSRGVDASFWRGTAGIDPEDTLCRR